jgi:hypothetical protein
MPRWIKNAFDDVASNIWQAPPGASTVARSTSFNELHVTLANPLLQRRKLNLKAKLKQNCEQFIIFKFQALNSRCFKCGFDRVNLHRPTLPGASAAMFLQISVALPVCV